MSCTERIILFHSPSVGVVISSPYYWDYYYDPWWYGSWRWPYYAWSSWWWYDPWYPGWGWGPPYWGHVHWPHRPLNVGSGLGQWRPGPTGGYVRYGNGYRRPSTGQFTTNRPGSVNTGRFGTTTIRRVSTGRRNFNMYRQSGTNQENNRTFNNNRRFNNSRSNNSTQQRSERSFSPSRSYSSPGRSFGSPGRSTGTSRGGVPPYEPLYRSAEPGDPVRLRGDVILRLHKERGRSRNGTDLFSFAFCCGRLREGGGEAAARLSSSAEPRIF